MSKHLARLGTAVSVVAALLVVPRPAFALSSAPDPTWGVKGKVYALAQSSTTLYVGGSFTFAIGSGGQQFPAANIAAFDLATGQYQPSFTARVVLSTGKAEVDALALSADGSRLYIGGKFDTIDGQARLNFGAVDAATGTQVDPNVTASPNKPVKAILAGPSLVYLGGAFTKVNGIGRLHLAAVWAPTAEAGTDPCPSQFPPGTNCGPTSDGGTGTVHSLAFSPDGTGVFVGGNFFYINGVPRNCLALVSAADGSLANWRVPWNTIPSESTSDPYRGPNVVWAILPTPTRVYIGYGRTPNGAEAYTMSAGTNGYVTSLWTRGTPGNVESLALSPDGTRLFVGGHFGTAVLDYRITCAGATVWVHGLLSLNPSNGSFFCDWFPQIVPFGGQSAPGSGQNPPNYVGAWAMQMTGNALFVGGYFTSISGATQSGWARFTLVGSPPPPPPAPVIASFSPTQGPIGTPVAITGSGFTGAYRVNFGSLLAESFTVDSDTQITATVPVGAVNGKIKVTTPSGSAASATSFKVTTTTVGGFSPDNGIPGTSVSISGSGFTGASDVTFGGVSVAGGFAVSSDSSITAVVPSAATTGPVCVTVSGVAACSAASFTVTAPPPFRRVGQLGVVTNSSGVRTDSLSLTLASGVAAGDTIVIGVGAQGAVGVLSVADSKGNTYAVDSAAQYLAAVGAKSTTALITAPVTTALDPGDTITVTVSRGDAWGFVAEDWTGLTSLDQTGAADSAGAATTTVSVTTAGATGATPEIAFAVVTANSTPAISSGSGASLLADVLLDSGGVTRKLGIEYTILGSAGAVTAGFTLGSARYWVAVVGTYR
jgi:hypothetical protein